MSKVVVVSGHPRPGSRTTGLAEAVGRALAGGPEPDVVQVSGLGADVLVGDAPATVDALDRIRKADLFYILGRSTKVSTPTIMRRTTVPHD